VERVVAALWQEMLGTERIGIHDEFFELGGSSLLAVGLVARLRERLGVELDPHVLLEAPTVAELAGVLAGKLAAAGGEGDGDAPPRAASLVVEVRPGEAAVPPLVLIHPAGGHVYRFRDLAKSLAEAGFRGPVLALRAPGLEAGEEPLGSVEEMAARYLDGLRRLRPEGPWRLAGSSMGGMIAYEMACRLHGEDEAPELVALLDTFGPGQMPDLLPKPAAEEGVDEPAEAGRARRVAAANTRAMFAYRPPLHPGRLVFLRAAERRPGDPPHPELAWIGLAAGGTAVHVVPGDHDAMYDPPHVAAVAAVLAGHLPEPDLHVPASWLRNTRASGSVAIAQMPSRRPGS
jgi:thioesterase domain-containing protein/acyl carrier protein